MNGNLSRSRTKFTAWKAEADQLMSSKYAISIVDAGIDDIELRKHWETWSAAEFVEWFGVKYDLTTVLEWN